MFNMDISDQEFNQIADLIYKHSGIKLKRSKKQLLRSRLRKRLKELDLQSFDAYYEHVFKDNTGRELSNLMEAISTNVTSLFRENKHFVFMKKQVIPRFKQKIRNNEYVHLWSAASSTGEEPYSMAITLLENMKNTPIKNIKILATDISRNAVQTAKEGDYPYKVVDGVNSLLIKRYFETYNDEKGKRRVKVKPGVKNMVSFGVLNLNRQQKFPFRKKFDIVFLRNVMIYFDNAVMERLVNRIYNHMKPGGYLLIGHSESLNRINHKFKYIQATIYQK